MRIPSPRPKCLQSIFWFEFWTSPRPTPPDPAPGGGQGLHSQRRRLPRRCGSGRRRGSTARPHTQACTGCVASCVPLTFSAPSPSVKAGSFLSVAFISLLTNTPPVIQSCRWRIHRYFFPNVIRVNDMAETPKSFTRLTFNKFICCVFRTPPPPNCSRARVPPAFQQAGPRFFATAIQACWGNKRIYFWRNFEIAEFDSQISPGKLCPSRLMAKNTKSIVRENLFILALQMIGIHCGYIW